MNPIQTVSLLNLTVNYIKTKKTVSVHLDVPIKQHDRDAFPPKFTSDTFQVSSEIVKCIRHVPEQK